MAGVFVKRRSGGDAAAFFRTEAAGLDWLRVPGGPPIPRVVALAGPAITIARVEQAAPTAAAAEDLGRRLARMHQAGAEAFGAAPPGAPGPHGWIGDLPMPFATCESFAPFWACDRLRATARLAQQRGGLSDAQASGVDRAVEAILSGQVDVGPPEPPSRLHGDLWTGNVLWGTDGRAWLIDPAAHGGHRESDLAMLALFGGPHVDRIIAAYDEAAPMAEGWRDRVPLHQAWPLLVHAALFGGGYGARAVAALDRTRG